MSEYRMQFAIRIVHECGFKIVLRPIMPRSRQVYNIEFPYHLTGRTNDGAIFPCTMDEAWKAYQNALWFCARIYEVRILAFVMMNNHYHLLATFPKGNTSEFMQYFQKRTSDDIRDYQKKQNHLYGKPYHPTLIDNQDYFEATLKYIYQNPVRAGVCKSVYEYDYSTIHGLLGTRHELIPIFDDFGFHESLESNILWLDQILTPDEAQSIQKSLYNQKQKPKRDKNGYLDDTLPLSPK